MQRDLATENVDISFYQGGQEKHTEWGCCRGLIDAADCRHGEAHDERRRSDDQSVDEKDTTDDEMRAEMLRTKAAAELKRGEQEKQHAGKNVDEGEDCVGREIVVESVELRADWIRCG